ncbi:CD99 molecule isoform X2 [Sphaeramia orbicularis]|uniref:CD99 molecule isoform X2 n=1 Tax=Sphaeramia orbicularis TaxID=375764 RepID=UPI0011800FA9|nr:CD99 antigen-like isoform X2 [Sphaeramia orbicularis]
MKLTLRVLVLFGLVTGTLSQGFDLSDALDDVAPTPAKPKDPPKKNDDFTLDLADAFDDSDPKPPTARPPAPVPPKTGGGGGGGSFGDSDLLDVSGGDYKPDGGKSGGRAADPGYDPQGGVDQPQGGPDLLWAHILKMLTLSANVPEEFYLWMSNLKNTLTPVVERVLDLLQALPGP